MLMFALEPIKEIKGRYSFFYLLKDGQNLFQEVYFQLEKEGSYQSELNTLQVRLQLFAEGMSMSMAKCRRLIGNKDKFPEFEIKTKHLRLYFFIFPNNGNIVVHLGKKTDQQKDIKKFRSLKSQYLEQESL